MATPSQVKVALDEIAIAIKDNRAVASKAKSNAASGSAALGLLPTTYADVIATIGNYGTSDAFEALAKAEFAKLSTEFTALVADLDAIAAVDLTD